MKQQQLLSYVRQSIKDYNMIDNNDKIAVGLSGGKDSVALLMALKNLQRFLPTKFELCAVTVSLGFKDMNFDKMKRLCDDNDINYIIEQTEIGEIVFNKRNEKNPCSLCSKMRKGALYNTTKKLGYNKVALGHNKDDVIQTFFLSLFYEGRINTFSPVTFLEDKQLTVIRPLIYVREKQVKGYINKYNLDIVKNTCKANGNTKREDMKNFVYNLEKTYPYFDEKIIGAINRANISDWGNIDGLSRTIK